MSIGEKIKTYRKAKKYSQLQLETILDMSPGSLSRIESGKVSPTKDTLHKLAKVLKLNKEQQAYLFDIAVEPVTEEEISEAIYTISDHYQDPNALSHLMDDSWNVRHFSDSFIKLLSFSKKEVDEMLGQNIMTLIFDPGSYYYRRIDPDFFNLFGEYVLSRKVEDFKEPMKPLVKELFDQLNQYDTFKKCWNIIKHNPREYFSNDSRSIFFKVNGKKFKAFYGRETIKQCPRFYVVEYTVL